MYLDKIEPGAGNKLKFIVTHRHTHIEISYKCVKMITKQGPTCMH